MDDLNKYNLYSLNSYDNKPFKMDDALQCDAVNLLLDELREYETVDEMKEYLRAKCGIKGNSDIIKFPKSKKCLFVNFTEGAIETKIITIAKEITFMEA